MNCVIHCPGGQCVYYSYCLCRITVDTGIFISYFFDRNIISSDRNIIFSIPSYCTKYQLTFFYYYAIRVCVSYNHVFSAIIMSLLHYYILLQFLHFITLLDVDNPFEQCHNRNHGKAIEPDHPARQASYRRG